MNVSIQQCEGKSEEIMEEDLDETISNEVMALEEKGHNYEIGDTIETEEVDVCTNDKKKLMMRQHTMHLGRSHQRAEITMLLS